MANADFSKQSSTQGPRGFDSGSYREAKRTDEDALHLTPAQQKLAVLENRLPTALRNRGAALALSIVVMPGRVLRIGRGQTQGKIQQRQPVVFLRRRRRQRLYPQRGAAHPAEHRRQCHHDGHQHSRGRQHRGAGRADGTGRFLRLPGRGAEPTAASRILTSLPYYQGSTMHALYQAERGTGRCHRPALCKTPGAGRRPHEDGRGAGPVRPVQQRARPSSATCNTIRPLRPIRRIPAASRPVC